MCCWLTVDPQDCGEAMYWDVKIKYGLSVQEQDEALAFPLSDRPTGRISSDPTSDSSNGNPSVPPAVHISAYNRNYADRYIPLSMNTPTDSVLLDDNSPRTPSLYPRFLELCVNTSRYGRTLGEIDVTDVNSDGELFAKTADTYEKKRDTHGLIQISLPKWFRSEARDIRFQWRFQKPNSVIFRRVRLCKGVPQERSPTE
jgi:hypothetical protein